MKKSLSIIAAGLGFLAGCGDNSGPAGPGLPGLAKYDLVGEWRGVAEKFSWKDNYYFLNDRLGVINSPDCILFMEDELYRLELFHFDDEVEFTLLEEGRWSWFKETSEVLFFDALNGVATEVQRLKGAQTSSFSWGVPRGGRRAWKCNLAYDPEKKSITLFNFDNVYDYGTIVLNKIM